MIQFEVLESPDLDVKTTFKYFQNQIYLGHSAGDLFIKDPALKPSHLMIEVHEQDLLVHPQKGIESYLVNGKRATLIKKVKVGDTLGIGKTVIKILSYEQTQQKSKKQILDAKLAELIDSNSLHLPVIEELSKLMK